jgi:hypothetical protein
MGGPLMHIANLGTAAVMDANKLVVGSYVEIDNEVLIVTNIVDHIHVYFRPLTTMERWQYRISQLSTIGKLLICAIVVGAVVIVFHIVRQG